jgi:antitoxin VapB
MALNIKDPEADRLARELASLTGQTITDALKDALTNELATARARAKARPDRKARIQEIIDRGRARPVLDDRSAEEILGYDEHGLPS